MLKNILKFYFPVVLIALLVSGIAYFVRTTLGQSFFLQDLGGVGLIVSFQGTIYTLISAFIIAEVWGQFNGMSQRLSEEAKSLASLWDGMDYLNDEGSSKKMKVALLSYLSVLMGKEIKEASKLVRSVHPSVELKAIHQVIDEIKFDDMRDSSIYPSLISDYEVLSSVRANRIEAGLSRIPLFLKSLLIVLTVMLVLSFIFLGFNSTWIFLASVFSVSMITNLIYKVVSDLDNPYEGIWNIDTVMLQQVKEYIEKSEHKN